MSRIYWDSMLFIYWLEDHPEHARRMGEIQARMIERGDTLCTSVFTVGEVLTGPHKRGALEVVAEIEEAFRSDQIELIPFTTEVANRYARLRGSQRVSPADAIHLASAGSAAVDLFLTNDHRLQPMIVPGIQFIAGLDVNLL